MSQIQITIAYNDDPEHKCGKLTFKKDGQTLLSKVPVAIPALFSGNTQTSFSSWQTSKEKLTFDPSLQGVGTQEAFSAYSKAFKSAQKLLGNLSNLGNADIDYLKVSQAPNDLYIGAAILGQDKKMIQTQDSFALEQPNVKVLLDNIRPGDKIDIVLSKGFLLFPQKTSSDTLSQAQRSLGLDTVRFSQALGQVRDTAIEAKFAAPKITPAPEAPKFSSPKAAPAPATNIKSTFPTNSTKPFKAAQPKVNRQHLEDLNLQARRVRETDDLNPLDVVFMYHNPEIAPFYKPNNMLAWVLYLENMNKNNTTVDTYSSPQHIQQLEQDFCRIQGLDNVESCRFEPTDEGYKIHLFEDKNQSVPSGEILYNPSEKCYTLNNSSDCLNINIQSDGLIKAELENQSGDTTRFSFAPSTQGSFVGSWESDPSQGVGLSGNFVAPPPSSPDSSYDFSSTLGNTKEVSVENAAQVATQIGLGDMLPARSHLFTEAPTPEYSSSPNELAPVSNLFSPDVDYSAQPNELPTASHMFTPEEPTSSKDNDWTPPPPPPPPPEWSSASDPYSRSFSP